MNLNNGITIKLNSENILDPKIIEGIEIILFKLGNLQPDESLCIVTDNESAEIADLFHFVSKKHHIKTEFFKIENLKIHGQEPPNNVANVMKNCNLILGLTTNSMAHTTARLNAASCGVRYLSLPNYTKGVLKHPSLRINYHELGKKAKDLADKFTSSKKISLHTNTGTKIELDISNRKGNFSPGYVGNGILLGSPPDIEANIPPIEAESEGQIRIDGSIPIKGLGILKNPILLKIEKGKLRSIKGDEHIEKFLNKLFDQYGEQSRILAEFGVGFNSKAKLCGNMLIDEGCYGTFHFGFGSNKTIGGTNEINFHLDFVFYADEINLDNQIIRI